MPAHLRDQRLALACAALIGAAIPLSVPPASARAATGLGSWTQVDNPVHPFARAYVAAAYDPDVGATVVFGGSSYSTPGLLNETWLRSHGGRWTKLTGPEPGPRQLAVMAYDPASHQVILFGGAGPAPPGSSLLTRLGDTWAFDGVSWKQLTPTASPPARFLAAMTYSAALQEIVLFGGNDPSGPDNDTWTWHAGTWHHVITAHAPSVRESPQLADDPSTGSALLYGGAPVAPFTPYSDTWSFNGADWTQLHPAHNPRGRAESAMQADSLHHDVVLFGGWDNNGLPTDTWLWNGSDWLLAAPSPSPFGRSTAGAAFDAGSGEVLVLFGDNSGNANFEDVWGWDGQAWHDRSVPLVPYQRFESMMGFDPVSGHTILFGGIGPDGNDLGDTWAFDGSSWSPLGANGPPPRRDAAFAFTPQGDGLLFGGFHNGTQLSDTWRWAASSGWQQLSPSFSPLARQGPTMAWDTAIGALVLFGGEGTVAFGDTYRWNGTTWAPVATALVPQGRAYASMAYDNVSARLVMFGGYGSGTFYGDTWSFDGTTWSKLSPSHAPAGRWDAAFGRAGGQLVLFGGTVDTGATGDTWAWNGLDWQQQNVSPSPAARQSPVGASDIVHDELVLFGGIGQIRYQDTWAFGSAPTAAIPEAPPGLLPALATGVAVLAMLRGRRRAARPDGRS